MQIQRQSQSELHKNTCIILGVFSDHTLTPMGIDLNTKTQGCIQKILNTSNISSQPGACLFIPFLPGTAYTVLLVNCGDIASLNDRQYLKILHRTAGRLSEIAVSEIYCALTELPVLNKDDAWKAFHAALVLGDKFYRFNQLKSERSAPIIIEKITIQTLEDKPLKEANIVINSMALVKDLANLPANICTPAYLADEAVNLCKKYKNLKSDILGKEEMEKLGMHSLLSVAQGSKNPPKLICFYYAGAEKTRKPIIFAGKGITFDTGGNSLKSPVGMEEMKYDMCGGATVFGLMQAAAELQLPLNIIGLVPAAENMPGNTATRPGDIVKSLSGKTIEILNTDAEGRLILCDTLTYAEKFSPEVVIDIATLTGAAVTTFGNIANVIMGNDQPLIEDLLRASENCGDRSWTLPLWEEYQEMLKSNFADIPNIHGDGNAKTIIAGCFLSRFTQKYRWAHIDIAGTAWLSGKEKGATGRPLTLLLNYLLAKSYP
jgi:leucyl aminopeptidase